MKKTYIAPKAEQINITTEGVVAASLTVYPDPDKKVDSSVPGNQLSQKRGWNSSLWATGNEE